MRRRERRELTRRVDDVEPKIERRFGCPACRDLGLIRLSFPGREADERCAGCGRGLLVVRLGFDPLLL
jgi:transcription elongation factor Elf1